MPQENKTYDIEDLLDVLYTDYCVRDLLDVYDENLIRTMTVGQKIRLFANGNELRFILERTPQGYLFTGVFAVTPLNDRSGCCNSSSQDLQFGMGFMGLGGNSFPGRAR